MRNIHNKALGLVVDNPRRDLSGLLMVAREWVLRGGRAYLIPMYQQGYEVPWLRLDAIVMNYIRPTNLSLIEHYADSGVQVYVMDTEGGILSDSGMDSPPNWARTVGSYPAARKLRGYFFWGALLHDAFAKLSGLERSRLHLTGCPRYDLCSPKWREIFSHGNAGRWILVNTNFSSINPRFSRGEEQEIQAAVDVGWDRAYFIRFNELMRQTHRRYLDTIRKVAQVCSDQTFLVRPHPFENEELYRAEFRNLPNVLVDGSKEVFEPISQAKCVLHLNCGSSVETLLLGKIPISMEFLNLPELSKHTPVPSTVSVQAQSLEQLEAILQRPEEELKELLDVSHVYQTNLQKWFHSNDGLASERLVNQIQLDISGTESAPRRSPVLSALRGSRPGFSLARLGLGLATSCLGGARVKDIRKLFSRSSVKFFTSAELQAITEKLALVDPEVRNLSIRYAIHPHTKLALSSVEIFLSK